MGKLTGQTDGKLHIVVDLEKCVGCYNCMVACKDEHVGNNWLPYTDAQQKHEQKWISPEKHERGTAPFTDMVFVTKLCQHCGDAPCEKAAPDAIIRRSDGIVLLDAQKAKGNKELIHACPYGSISWNEELRTVQKCTMCAHLLDEGWSEPRCVQACPLRALSVVFCDDNEFKKTVKKQKLQPLTDGKNNPRVMYKNLYRLDTCFVAGALAYRDNEETNAAVKNVPVEKAAADADVKLMQNGKLIAEVKTDFFGEFKIDRIPKNSGAYELYFSLSGHKAINREVTIGQESPCLEVMLFEKN